MRFEADRSNLLRALGHVTGIVERRNTIPILSNILLSAHRSGDLRLKATDLDIEAVETVDAHVEQAGAATVQAHTLHDIIRKLPDTAKIEFDLRSGEGRLRLSTGRATFELSILPASEFPDLGQVELPTRFELAQADLKRLFEKARFAISTEETRYYLNGIYLHTAEREGTAVLRAVSTDGHRLALVDVDRPGGSEAMTGVIVPRKAVAEIIKVLDGGSNPVGIALSASKIQFSIGGVVLTSKLIDGSFPDYARVIPATNSKVMRIDNSSLVKAVDRVSTLSSDKGRAVKLNLSADKLTVSVNNAESGSATEEIVADYTGEGIEIGFNARYLLDIASQIEGERAEFKFADASSPTLVSEDGDRTALYVLMPMRV